VRRCRLESLGVSLPNRRFFKWGSVRHAIEAGKRCLAGSHYHPDDVAVLINTGVNRDDHTCEPAIACYIQNGLDINAEFQGRRTLAFDLLNGGAGMLNGLHVLTSLLQSGSAQVGMVVSSEVNTDKDPDPGYPYPASGAAVMLDLSPRSAVGFGAFAFDTRDDKSDLFTSIVSLKVKRGKLLMRRKAELEEAYLVGAAAAVEEVLAKDGLKREDIDLVVPAQISPAFLAKLPAAIGCPKERVADFTADLPDTHSTSVFLALQRALSAQPLAAGKKALLLAFGSGVTVGAATYHY
jgi:3-oxoacyl-[acyl-carrier-protein] synthase-3